MLQFIVLATAWNILGGYCGYVNFGSAAFFALGAYSSVALHKLGANVDRYFPESLAGLAHADPAAERSRRSSSSAASSRAWSGSAPAI